MTKQEDYPAQVAELIEQSFKCLGNSMASTDPGERAAYAIQADLKIKAAQAVATLATAREVRVQTLAHMATAVPADGSPVNSELVQEAYTYAAYGLGLIQEEPDQERVERFRQAFQLDNDPADADLGDLK